MFLISEAQIDQRFKLAILEFMIKNLPSLTINQLILTWSNLPFLKYNTVLWKKKFSILKKDILRLQSKDVGQNQGESRRCANRSKSAINGGRNNEQSRARAGPGLGSRGKTPDAPEISHFLRPENGLRSYNFLSVLQWNTRSTIIRISDSWTITQKNIKMARGVSGNQETL